MALELLGSEPGPCSPKKPGWATILNTVIKDTSYGRKKKQTGEWFTVATWGEEKQRGLVTPQFMFRVLTWGSGLNRGQKVCIAK